MAREDAAGRETTDVAYDQVGRVASVAFSGGRVVTYAYDEAGRRVRTTETQGARIQVTDYAYDALGRLVRVGDEVFIYNAAGDLIRRRSPGRTIEYRWDFEGRLAGYRDGRREVAFDLDGDDRRVGVTVDGRKVAHPPGCERLDRRCARRGGRG